jgi:hypothetical protein
MLKIDINMQRRNPMNIQTKYADNAVIEAGFLLNDLGESETFDHDEIINRLAEVLKPWAARIAKNFHSEPSFIARLVAEVMVLQFYVNKGELVPEN